MDGCNFSLVVNGVEDTIITNADAIAVLCAGEFFNARGPGMSF